MGRIRKYSDDELREIIKEAETTSKPKEKLFQEYGISSSTYYRERTRLMERPIKMRLAAELTNTEKKIDELRIQNRILEDDNKRLKKEVKAYQRRFANCQVRNERLEEKIEQLH